MAPIRHHINEHAVVGVNDMVLLTDVSEAGILKNLKRRHASDIIYTYIGQVLVVLNPYKWLNIYDDTTLKRYVHQNRIDVPPHVFSISEDAYRMMLLEKDHQCIIISGESGAGKTEASKQIQNYIATISHSGTGIDKIKRVFLESNPLLEAFGNAKTGRNNNSSRFGKFFELFFDEMGQPQGGKVTNYLLEKSRIIKPRKEERNFHIFYQILRGLPQNSSFTEKLGLSGTTKKPHHFKNLNISECYDIDGVDDQKEFDDTMKAMQHVGMKKRQIELVIQACVAILHLGNVDFRDETIQDAEGSAIKSTDPLITCCKLLGVSSDECSINFCFKYFETMAPGGKIERYQVPQNPSQACARRDSLAKIIYGRIFDFLVERINHALDLQRRVDEMETTNASHRTLNMDEMPKLGILDIYGFEVFDQNGFEQFCINYVNEKLQQLFIELTLRSEQDEYAREGIEWTPIPFFNNKVVCDLMDANYIKQTRQAVAQSPGIFLVLDDTVKTMHSQEGEAIDKTFLDKVTSTHQNHPHFAKRGRDFEIRHYAGTVQYHTHGFGDTNKGAVSPELYSMLQKSKNKLIRYLFPASDMEEEEKRSSNRRKQMAAPTAGSKIRTQCEALIQTLMECSPHYVRCLKSNDQKQANRFDDGRVLHQIQYLGLLENLRVRRSGFAYRGEYGRFLDRFRIISSQTYPEHVFTGSDKKGTQLILRSAAEGIPKLKEEAQFGKTMVFIRTPETLFAIEKLREEVIGRYVRKIQHVWRSYFGQRYFLKLNHDISKLYEANGKLRQRVSICRPFHGKYLLKENTDEIHSRIWEIMRFYGDSEKIIFADFVDKVMPRAGPRNSTKDIEVTKGFWDCESVYFGSRLLVLSDQYLYVIEQTIPSSVEGGDSRNEKVPKLPIYRLRQRAHITMIEGILLSTYADPCFILQIRPEPLLKEPIRNNWLEDRSVLSCMDTGKKFGLFNRRHHCRFTGKIYCDEVCKRVEVIPSLGYYTPVRVHDSCIGNISTEMLEDQLFLSEKKSEIVSLLADTIRLLGDGKTIPVQFENSVQLRTASDKELSRSPQQKIIFSTADCDELKLTGDQNSLQIYAPTGVPKEYSVNRRKRAKARRQRSEAIREEERAQRAQRRAQLEQEREHERIERIKVRKAKKQADKDARMRATRSSDTNASLLVQSESNKMRSSRNYTNTNTPGFTQQDSGGMGSELAAILARRRGNAE